MSENEARVIRFEGAVLQILLCAPTSQEGFNETGLESFIIVADDLPILAKFLQWLLYSAPTQAKVVTRYNLEGDHLSNVSQDFLAFGGETGQGAQPQLVILFQTKNTSPPNRATQEALFQSLSNVTGGRIDVKIEGLNFDLSSYFNEMLPTRFPGSVYVLAVGWHMIETVREFKATADRLATSGDTARALVWYKLIWQLFSAGQLFQWTQYGIFDVERTNAEELETLAILDSLMLKAAISEGVLRIKTGNVDRDADKDRLRTMDLVQDFNSRLTHPTCCSIRDTTALAGYHRNIFAFLYNRTDGTFKHVIKAMDAVS